MSEVDFESTRSLYKQIKNIIKEQILAGEYKHGEKIPSERELCEKYKVSRITVRQAINEAVNEGLLYKVQGKGTFVAGGSETIITQGLVKITSFGNTFSSRGMSAKTKILGHCIKHTDFALSKILNLDIIDQVFNLDLLGIAEGIAMVLYQSYFQANCGLRIYQEALKFEQQGIAFSTMDLYQDFGDLKPSYVEQTYEALVADRELAGILQIREGSPLFLVSSIIYTREHTPVEFRKAYYRADKYKFHIKRDI